MNVVVKGISAFLVIIYPLVIYFGLEHFEPKYLAIFLGLILLLRFVTGNSMSGFGSRKQHLFISIAIIIILFITLQSNTLDGLKVYPVIVSFSLLAVFGYSLINPPTVIERLARLKEPELSEEGVIYTRNVTKVWCIFFLLNGMVALYTSFFATIEVWTLYNGIISYLIMGCLFAGELVFRKLHLAKSK